MTNANETSRYEETKAAYTAAAAVVDATPAVGPGAKAAAAAYVSALQNLSRSANRLAKVGLLTETEDAWLAEEAEVRPSYRLAWRSAARLS